MELRPATDPKKDQSAEDQRRERYNGGAAFPESWRHDRHFIAQCHLIQCQMGMRRGRIFQDSPSPAGGTNAGTSRGRSGAARHGSQCRIFAATRRCTPNRDHHAVWGLPYSFARS